MKCLLTTLMFTTYKRDAKYCLLPQRKNNEVLILNKACLSSRCKSDYSHISAQRSAAYILMIKTTNLLFSIALQNYRHCNVLMPQTYTSA